MIGAVVVLYNPDFALLDRVLEALSRQVDMLCVVDNSAQDNSRNIARFENLDYTPLCENRGIAAAQNIGIGRALQRGCRYILLSDQDSIASEGLIGELRRRYRILSHLYDVAAVGPMPINRHSGAPYISPCHERILRTFSHEGYNFYEAHSIISSFSFISAKAFAVVGAKSEELFIDFVDQEWCWRARHKGLRVFVAPDLWFLHEQGRYREWLGLGLNISTPARLYYQIRNLLWLSRSHLAPRRWKRTNLRKLCYKIVGYPLLIAPRSKYIGSIVRGLWDGLTQRKRYETRGKNIGFDGRA